MEVLELKPVKNQKISVILAVKPKNIRNKVGISRLIKFLEYKEIKFISIEIKEESIEDFRTSELFNLINNSKVPYYFIDIPEFVKGYIYGESIKKEEEFRELTKAYNLLQDKESFNGQSLKIRIEVLKDDLEKMNEFFEVELRLQWIAKKILEQLKKFKSCNEVSFLHLVERDHLIRMIRIFKDLNMEVILDRSKGEIKLFNIIINKEEIRLWEKF